MHIKQVWLLVFAFVVSLSEVYAEGKASSVTPNIVDENGDVSRDAAWISGLQTTLQNFESKSGIRVLVQFHDKSPPEKEDLHPGDYMRALATRLGVIQRGILIVHFGDDPDWRVWIGDDLTPKFVGEPGNAKEFTENGAMHKAKEAVLTAAMAGAAGKYASLNLPKTDPKMPATGVLLRLQTDAIIDGLKGKFAH